MSSLTSKSLASKQLRLRPRLRRLRNSSKELTLEGVLKCPDEKINAIFHAAKWENSAPHCNVCGCSSKQYASKTHPGRFNCGECKCQYTVMSGSCLSASKASKKTILSVMVFLTSSKKGMSALHLSGILGVNYKPLYTLIQKLRECMLNSQFEERQLSGEVVVDGCFMGGHMRKSNEINPATGKFKFKPVHGDRRVVVVAREKGPGGLVRTFVGRKESDAIDFVNSNVSVGSRIHCDSAKSWNKLGDLHTLMRINHSLAFSKDGACSNDAERFFGMLRRKQRGVHHKISGKHLHLYAAEAAWYAQQTKPQGETAFDLLKLALRSPKSVRFVGYCTASKAKCRTSTEIADISDELRVGVE